MSLVRGAWLRSLAVPVTLVCVLTACEDESATAPRFDGVIAHESGLMAPAPIGFDHRVTPDGLVFQESGGLRSPRYVRIGYVKKRPAFLESASRSIAGGTADFEVTTLNGGSGGVEHQLMAAKSVAGGWITVTAVTQTEFGQPSFDLAWAVLEEAYLAE